ncbi:hypothetical protein C8Q76DRAFT_695767 [Earliella scabrosa]|nr:hypothetical protein C8Q76DRAFT_695767 [Earliella scabrosa]
MPGPFAACRHPLVIELEQTTCLDGDPHSVVFTDPLQSVSYTHPVPATDVHVLPSTLRAISTQPVSFTQSAFSTGIEPSSSTLPAFSTHPVSSTQAVSPASAKEVSRSAPQAVSSTPIATNPTTTDGVTTMNVLSTSTNSSALALPSVSTSMSPNPSSSSNASGAVQSHSNNGVVAGIAASMGITALCVVASAIRYISRQKKRKLLAVIDDLEAQVGGNRSLVPQRSSFDPNTAPNFIPGRRDDVIVCDEHDVDEFTVSYPGLLMEYPSSIQALGRPRREDPDAAASRTRRDERKQDNLHDAVNMRTRIPRHATDGGVRLAGGVSPPAPTSGVPALDEDQRSDSDGGSTLPPPYSQYE